MPALRSLAVAMLFAVAAIPGCEDIQPEPATPLLSVSPSWIEFGPLAVGDSADASLLVENPGDTALWITGVTVEGPTGVFAVDAPDVPFALSPDERRSLRVTYTPQGEHRVTGSVVFTLNERRGDRELFVALVGREPVGRVAVFPDPIDFRRVPAGETSEILVEVQNIGTSDLTVSQLIVVSGSGEFAFARAYQDATPIVVSPVGREGDRVLIPITYNPTTDGFDSGRFIVISDEAWRPELEVQLQANGAEPCIAVTGEGGFGLDSGWQLRTYLQRFTITNCSDVVNGADLEVTEMSLEDAPDSPRPTFVLEALPSLPLVLPPTRSSTFVVTYAPNLASPLDRAVLRIRSNDHGRDPLEIVVEGVNAGD